MARRIAFALIALAMLLSAAACKTPEPVPVPVEQIERRAATAYTTSFLCFKGDGVLLNVTHPKEWSFEKSDAGLDIKREGQTVGQIVEGSAEGDFTVLESHRLDKRGVEVSRYLELSGTDNYRLRYVYKYDSDERTRRVTLTVGLSETDKKTADKLLGGALAKEKVQSDTIGILPERLKKARSIIILGNSFVGSSAVGRILSEMLEVNGKDCRVRAVSRGYAQVGTYTDDAAMMADIGNGYYDAVFICGFYGDEQIENLGILKRVCEKSNTVLVIFPAHNENAGLVSDAAVRYPTLTLLNWKAEIDRLIKDGVDRWDMYVNDAHRHSTPLAGYVGAHMIYRAMYGTMPFMPISSELSQLDVDEKLGDYAYVGDAKITPESKITYLN